MRIDRNMSLYDLQDRMGSVASVEDAARLKIILRQLDYCDTEEIPEAEWLRLCTIAADDNRMA